MRKVLVGIVSIIIASSVHSAQQENAGSHRGGAIHRGFVKAGDFLEWDENGRNGYAMGLLDGMYMAPAFGAPDNNKVLIDIATCAEGMKSSQVVAIIDKYLRDHPEKWHWDLKDIGYNAMLTACPLR
jgi:hypothetical protein